MSAGKLPTRADIEAYHCPASIEGGILTFENGATIDLGELFEVQIELVDTCREALKTIEREVPLTSFAPRERLKSIMKRATK